MATFLSSKFLVFVALLSFVLYNVISRISLYFARRRFKQQNGCKPPRRAGYSRFLFGVDSMAESIRWAKEHRITKLFQIRYNTWGHTHAAERFGRPVIQTIEPENIKAILSTKFKDFALGPFRQETMGHFLGSGIFTTDGDDWATSRHMIRPNFTRDQVADLAAFERHIQDLFAAIPRDGSTVELQELFFRFTIDSATEFLFGQSVRSLRRAGSTEDAENHFAEAFQAGQEDCLKRMQMGPLRFWAKPTKIGDQTAVQIAHEYVDQFVDRAVSYRDSLDAEKHPEMDSKKYVFLHELAKQTKDKKRIRDELLNVLLAGRDTTASLLGNMFNVISRRPDVWQKLRAEVGQLEGKPPTYEQLKDLKYLRQCLNESLRLHPVVPGNSRTAIRDTVLPVGGGEDGKSPVFVPKNGLVSYSVFAMHRRKDLYGEDAEEFKPERWATLRPGWEYLPFNGGPRICIGQQYALAEASYVTARIVQEFARIECRDEEEWQEQVTLTMCSNRGALVSLAPA
ncbi:cytochrome P450 52A12 [Saccharata proteae CBS 121410]|uniref:Cytochrome P450 52A12 n=1 Tax=Saccharata proteae CBS 121410 TaxID=1314787 RepID=A0A9P4HVE6_9PEZI|nr:cytochrome P450 52A12 [Saccharata proteae CBS 121410]